MSFTFWLCLLVNEPVIGEARCVQREGEEERRPPAGPSRDAVDLGHEPCKRSKGKYTGVERSSICGQDSNERLACSQGNKLRGQRGIDRKERGCAPECGEEIETR